jgi:hypothetical protein
MTIYLPRPGSFPARLIEHLTAVGGTMTKSEMAQGFAEPRKNIEGLTSTVIKHGLIVDCGERDNGTRAYGLPGSDAAVISPPPRSSLTLGLPAQQTDSAPKKKKTRPAEKRVTVLGFMPSVVPTATAPLVRDLPPPPIAALWEDGDICLYGLQINADESATIGEAHARRLHKFLERVFGPTE